MENMKKTTKSDMREVPYQKIEDICAQYPLLVDRICKPNVMNSLLYTVADWLGNHEEESSNPYEEYRHDTIDWFFSRDNMDDNMDAFDEARRYAAEEIYRYMKKNGIKELSDADFAALVKGPDEKGQKARHLIRAALNPIDCIPSTDFQHDKRWEMVDKLTLGDIKRHAAYDYEVANVYSKYADDQAKLYEEFAKLREKYQIES